MIQLASDPNASRMTWRAAPPESKDNPLQARGRSGHAWPFISRHAGKPAPEKETPSKPSGDHGS